MVWKSVCCRLSLTQARQMAKAAMIVSEAMARAVAKVARAVKVIVVVMVTTQISGAWIA